MVELSEARSASRTRRRELGEHGLHRLPVLNGGQHFVALALVILLLQLRIELRAVVVVVGLSLILVLDRLCVAAVG